MVKIFKAIFDFVKEDFLLTILLGLLCVDRFGSLPIYLCLILPFLSSSGKNRFLNKRNATIICVFSVIYSSIALINGYFDKSFGSFFFFLLYPLFFYWVGEYIGSKKSSYIEYILIVISIFFAIYPILMVLLDISQNQFVNVSRDLLDTNGEKIGNATIIGTKVSLTLSFIGVFFVKEKRKSTLLLTITLLILSFLSLAVNLHLVNRTGLFVFFASLFLSFYINRGSLKQYYLYLIIAFFVFLIYMNRGYLEFMFSESTIAYQERADRGSSFENGGGRFDIWSKAINDIEFNPFGVNYDTVQRSGYHYAHNIFLDLPLRASLFSLIFFLAIVIIHLKNLLYIYRVHPPDTLLTLIFIMNIALFIQLLSEPVMDSIMAYYFVFYLMIGICSAIVKRHQFQNLSLNKNIE